jgi:hypothetical protein
MSFRGTGAAREPESYEHRRADICDSPMFMVSGPALLGIPE